MDRSMTEYMKEYINYNRRHDSQLIYDSLESNKMKYLLQFEDFLNESPTIIANLDCELPLLVIHIIDRTDVGLILSQNEYSHLKHIESQKFKKPEDDPLIQQYNKKQHEIEELNKKISKMNKATTNELRVKSQEDFIAKIKMKKKKFEEEKKSHESLMSIKSQMMILKQSIVKMSRNVHKEGNGVLSEEIKKLKRSIIDLKKGVQDDTNDALRIISGYKVSNDDVEVFNNKYKTNFRSYKEISGKYVELKEKIKNMKSHCLSLISIDGMRKKIKEKFDKIGLIDTIPTMIELYEKHLEEVEERLLSFDALSANEIDEKLYSDNDD
jgi:hypothetical protein